MAKTLKRLEVVLDKSSGSVEATGYMTVGSSDDASLEKQVTKKFSLDAGDQADADSLYASLESEMKTDEGIS